MSTTILKFMIPPEVNEPRGARWVAALAAITHTGWCRLERLFARRVRDG